MVNAAAGQLDAYRTQIEALKNSPGATDASRRQLDQWLAAVTAAINGAPASAPPPPTTPSVNTSPAAPVGQASAPVNQAPASPAPAVPPAAEQPAASPAAPATPAPAPADQTQALYGGGPSKVTFSNTTDKDMVLQFRRNGESEDISQKITVKAGQTVEVSLPTNWAGNVRKLDGVNDSNNLMEFTFENGRVMYDESDETGRNVSAFMSTTDGLSAGIRKSIIDNAPEGSYAKTASGEKVLLPSKSNAAAYQHLSNNVGANNAYIHYADHKALRTSFTNSLSIELGNA